MITNEKALRLARKLMEQHDLMGWTLEFFVHKKNIAHCAWTEKRIGINTRYLSQFSDQEFVQVILHEIAHELDRRWYGQVGHGSTFKKTCARIGCKLDGPYMLKLDKPVERALVLFAPTKAMIKRTITVDYEPPIATMKVVDMELWKRYDMGRISYQEFKAEVFV